MLSEFLTVLLAATLVLLVITRLAADRLVSQHHAQKSDFFKHHPIHPGDIVFLGDSITDGSRWHELFPGLPVKNRGINADTVSGVLHRLDDVLTGPPAAVFILIGTNDLPVFMFHTNDDILETYTEILDRCRSQAPHTRIYVQSILPRTPRFSRRIRALNAHLKALAESHGATFIDLFPHFLAPDGGIRPEISNDRLHLMGDGYEIWVGLLQPYLAEIQGSSGPATQPAESTLL